MFRLFLLSVLLVLHMQAIAQSGDQNPLKFDVIPPGPEAASIGKFVDQPVSAYTGVPNISIPIYTLTSYELSLPISLSYHASGIKWEETPSWVGAGWTLNAGGIVSRTVRGRNDEDPVFGYFMQTPSGGFSVPSFFSGSTFSTVNFMQVAPYCDQGETPQEYLNVLYASMGGLDLEPDQFFFSLPDGQSGKFVFSRSQQMRLIPHQFANITHTPSSLSGIPFDKWLITGKDGTKYFFEKQETSVSSSPCKTLPTGAEETRYVPDVEAVSSWKLVRMENASGTDYINFNYVAETYTQRTRMSTTTYDNIESQGSLELPPSSYCSNITTTSGWRLSEITTKSGYKVVFVANTSRADLPGSKWLDKIKIYHNDTFLKRFDLTYTGLITTIGTIQEFFADSLNSAKVPSYEFTYYTEVNNAPLHPYSRDSKSLDHWGYYNATDTTAGFSPPVIYNNVYYAGGNRQAHLEACQWMTLKKIKYPTGGTAEFEYELNDFSNLPENPLLFDHLAQLELLESIEFAVTNTNKPRAYQNKSFTLTDSTSVVLFYEVPSLDGGGAPAEGLHVTLSKSSGAPFTTQWFQSGATQVVSSSITVFTPGTYNLNGEFDDKPNYFDPGTQKFYVKVYRVKDTRTLVEGGELNGGGLRIKRIRSFGDNTITKTYSYISTTTGKSSGKLMTFPSYSYSQVWDNQYMQQEGGENCTWPPQGPGWGTMLVRANAPTISLGVSQGSYVGYSEVTEFLGDSTSNNGYTVYTFTNTPDMQNETYPFVPALSSSYKNGLALSTKVYTADHKLVQEVRNAYSYHSDTGTIIQGAKIAQAKSNSCTDCVNRVFSHNVYSELTERVLLQSTETRVYDVASDSCLTTSTSFAYNSYDQISEKTESVSNETERKKHTVYNYHSTFRTSPVEEYSFYTPEVGRPSYYIGGVSRQYFSPQRPTDIYLLERTPDIEATDTPGGMGLYKHRLHVEYNSNGNAISVTKTGDPAVTTYIWDNAGIFPIAQVMNATPAGSAFTGFENDSDEGGWTFTLSKDLSDKKTGASCHNLNESSISRTGLNPAESYVISYWAKGAVPNVTGSPDGSPPEEEPDGWTYYEMIVTGVTSVTISASGSSKIDELRMYPVNAQMTTYAYDVRVGLISSTDVNNTTTYFDYNNRQQLEFIRDFEKNILKKNEYRYVRD